MIVKDLSNSFSPFPKTPKKEKERKTTIKNKSNKLAKKEKERFSILTKDLKKCYLCQNKKIDMHEIYKGCNRQISIKHGFCIPICRICHSKTEIDTDLDLMLKIKCQKEYEKTHTREEFIEITGQSYIDKYLFKKGAKEKNGRAQNVCKNNN